LCSGSRWSGSREFVCRGACAMPYVDGEFRLDEDEESPEDADEQSLTRLDATPPPSHDFTDFYGGLLKFLFLVVAFIILLSLISLENS